MSLNADTPAIPRRGARAVEDAVEVEVDLPAEDERDLDVCCVGHGFRLLTGCES